MSLKTGHGPYRPIRDPEEVEELPDGFVCIPAGDFWMGSPSSEPDRKDDEIFHAVRITRSFLLKETPVTQAEWQGLVGYNPSEFKGSELPVESVSWFDAVTYCNALSNIQGFEEAYLLSDVEGRVGEIGYSAQVLWKGLDCPGYRLPTEAEWEYACRAGSPKERLRRFGRVAQLKVSISDMPLPVGQKKPNDWGLHDMLGNVREWCHDWYGDYPVGAVTDPAGPEAGSVRVFRGSSWLLKAKYARAANRNGSRPGVSYNYLGLRPARSLPVSQNEL